MIRMRTSKLLVRRLIRPELRSWNSSKNFQELFYFLCRQVINSLSSYLRDSSGPPRRITLDQSRFGICLSVDQTLSDRMTDSRPFVELHAIGNDSRIRLFPTHNLIVFFADVQPIPIAKTPDSSSGSVARFAIGIDFKLATRQRNAFDSRRVQ